MNSLAESGGFLEAALQRGEFISTAELVLGPNGHRAVDNPSTSTIKTASARLAISANAPCQGCGWK